jgi:hypothetical protein
MKIVFDLIKVQSLYSNPTAIQVQQHYGVR